VGAFSLIPEMDTSYSAGKAELQIIELALGALAGGAAGE
jgi:hypothetical protein